MLSEVKHLENFQKYSLNKRITAFLLTDCSNRPMAGIDFGLIRQYQQLFPNALQER